MMENRILLVLGMHRSGTSLTAQWLHACGLNLGDRLMGTGVANVKGHYEDLDFHDLHEEIFRANGVTYGGLKPVPPLALDPYQQAKMKTVIGLKNSLREEWGWKDPRTCLFLDHYRQVLESPLQPAFLVVFRPAGEVVDSLLRRWKKESQSHSSPAGEPASRESSLARKKVEGYLEKAFARDFLDSWIQYNEAILQALDPLDPDQYLVTGYSDLMKNSEAIFAWLTRRGFQLSYVPFQEVFDSSLMATTAPPLAADAKQGSRIAAIESRFSALIQTRARPDSRTS